MGYQGIPGEAITSMFAEAAAKAEDGYVGGANEYEKVARRIGMLPTSDTASGPHNENWMPPSASDVENLANFTDIC